MPRFQDIYKAMKKGEERITELEKKLESSSSSDNSALIGEMKEHNANLMKTIEHMRESGQSGNADEALKGLEDKLVELVDLKKKARESANFDAETNIDEKMADLRVDIRDSKKAIAAENKGDNNSGKNKDKEDSKMSDDDKIEYDDWIADNEWYTKDSKKKAAAISFERKIVKEPRFKDSTITEVLEEVGKRVEDKFKRVEGVNTVETNTILSQKQPPGSVRVSPVESDIAKGLGVSIEAYAKQKALIAGGKK